MFFRNFALQIYAYDEIFRRLGGFETYFKSVYLRLILGRFRNLAVSKASSRMK